jgi:predicted metalloprotease
MKWRGRKESTNVEDRRGQSGGGQSGGGFGGGGLGGGMGNRGGFGGGGMRMPRLPIPGGGRGGGGRGGLGRIGLLIVVGLLFLAFGGDLGSLLGGGQMTPGDPGRSGAPTASRQGLPGNQAAPGGGRQLQDELAQFVSVVLADTEETWHTIFREGGGRYEEPTLVLFSNSVRSACGHAQAAMGPFYCPADRKVYIDLSFYDDLRSRFGAPGDFAQAYVIAHEVGHHVQTLLGISAQVRQAQAGASKAEANQLQVRMELQADCFAGLWAHHAERRRDLLDPGDIDAALTAAAAIGDDRLQKQSQGYVVPDAFTHGTSEQRQRWFRIGYAKGSFSACNTFEANL